LGFELVQDVPATKMTETQPGRRTDAEAATPPPVLEGRRIEKTFQIGPEQIEVLRKVDLKVNQGEMVAILGPSGAGKSTLLHILAGLDRPTEGEVLLTGVSLTGFREEELTRFRNRNIGLIFQFHHLLPEFTVLENVMMPCLIAGETRTEAKAKAEQALMDLNFTIRMRHRPSQLSGGEKQKVATARALVLSPLVVLADEPTGNLDSHSAKVLMDLLKEINLRKQATMIIVSHNQRVAAYCDRRLYLDDGLLKDVDAALT
jgi:lipoprotein-releasing system ATP-binding protein